MDLKALREKRVAKIAEGNKLFNDAETEVRSLTEEEVSALAEIRSEVEKIDATIAQEKEFRNALGEETLEAETRDNEMTSELETRALGSWLRNDMNEYRDITAGMTAGNGVENTAGNGGITIPTSVFDQIIEKLGQEAPVFALSQQFPSANGRLKIARETTASDDEGFIGEAVNAPALTSTLRSIVLDQKRVAASFQLTNELISDAAFNVVNYAVDRVSRAVGRTINRNILVGAKAGETESFAPVIGANDVKVINVGTTITVDGLIDMYSSLHQAYQNGAVWVMSKPVFQQVAKLKDGNGQYLIFQGIVDGVPEYNLFGAKVFIDDVMEGAKDGQQIIFGNFGVGYAVMVKKGMNLTHVTQDTVQAMAGGHLVVLDAYLDGAVKNPDGFIVGKLAAPASK